MPRKARIDAAGALHHIICRGIEKTDIFRDDIDRNNFVDRLGQILSETNTPCFAWALLPNHFHLLLRTGETPTSIIMRRLLTGYAVSFNRRHQRHGHLFQNRFKSILCQEDSYLLELVRYIHLNPLRAKVVTTLEELDRFPYCGHSSLMGYEKNRWQDAGYILSFFGKRVTASRRQYRNFASKAVGLGRNANLTGGGLVRSSGGWERLKSSRRRRVHLKGDERILGDSDFVESVLDKAEEKMVRKYRLADRGYDFDTAVHRTAELFEMSAGEILLPGKQPNRVKARSLLCFWAVKELGISSLMVAAKLGISQSAVSRAVQRGAQLATANNFPLEND
ncbi:MAG: transposase [Desulfobacterales bacterium]|nr:transposase [Desulfobacterales bacterium]